MDHRVIWQTPTEASLRTAIEYYHDALDGPQWLAAGVAGLTAVAVAAILLKLSKGTTSRVLFDGGSLRTLLCLDPLPNSWAKCAARPVLYSAALFIYSQNVHTSRPNDSSAYAYALTVVLAGFAVLAAMPKRSATLPSTAFGAISQIASAHAIIAVTLTGVVALQGAQYYSERQIQKEVKRELKKIDTAQNTAGTPAPGSPVKFSASSSQTLQAPAGADQEVRRSPRKKK